MDTTLKNFDLHVFEPGTDPEEQRKKIVLKEFGMMAGRKGDKIPGLWYLPYHLSAPVLYGFKLPRAYLKLPENCSDCLLHCTSCLQLKEENHDKQCKAYNRRCYACNYYGHIAAACPAPDPKLYKEEKEEDRVRSVACDLPPRVDLNYIYDPAPRNDCYSDENIYIPMEAVAGKMRSTYL